MTTVLPPPHFLLLSLFYIYFITWLIRLILKGKTKGEYFDIVTWAQVGTGVGNGLSLRTEVLLPVINNCVFMRFFIILFGSYHHWQKIGMGQIGPRHFRITSLNYYKWKQKLSKSLCRESDSLSSRRSNNHYLPLSECQPLPAWGEATDSRQEGFCAVRLINLKRTGTRLH